MSYDWSNAISIDGTVFNSSIVKELPTITRYYISWYSVNGCYTLGENHQVSFIQSPYQLSAPVLFFECRKEAEDYIKENLPSEAEVHEVVFADLNSHESMGEV